MQNVLLHTGQSGMVENPATPLHDYAPGRLASKTPEERGRALKRKKRVLPSPSLLTPATMPPVAA